ncbi:MAG: OmpA family protein [Flavihumibacter sp.]|nr:OmpA family protein [Flavihumibacter sp.]
MKRIVILSICFGITIGGYSQTRILNKVKSKTTAKVNQRVDRHIDNAIDETLDEIESGGKEAIQPADTTKENKPVASKGINTQSRFDFIPGEQLVYFNDFSSDPVGELPINWNTNGTAEVVTIEGLEGKWVQLFQNATYLTDNTDSLSENFTVEFDLIMKQTNPKAPFPVLAFGVLASGNYSSTANELLKGYTETFATELNIQPLGNNDSQLHLYTFQNQSKYLNTDLKRYGKLQEYFNRVLHVSMQVQKERLRIWLDGTKLYDLPKAIAPNTSINQFYFVVRRYGGEEAEVGYAVGNIRMAKGLPDTRHKLLTEGRFSTTGILFEKGSARIEEQSNGVLKQLAEVLKAEAVRIKIIGHTDSDGNDAGNLELSRKRAAAVKATLVENFGIEASRIETDGKGESESVGDNQSKAGRAQNRRVEFIRL